MNRSLKTIIVSVFAISGLIIPQLGFAANPKNKKAIIKKVAVVKRKITNKKTTVKKAAVKKVVVKTKAPAQKQIRKAKPVRTAPLKNTKVSKSVKKVKRQPKKAKPIKQQFKDCFACCNEKPVQTFTQLACGHHNDYCKECALVWSDAAVERNNLEALKCRSCNKPWTDQDIQGIIKFDPARIQKYQAMLAKRNTKPCPTADCTGRFPIDPNQEPVLVRCAECNHERCSRCLLPHNPQEITCAQAEAAANGADHTEWLKEHTKPCPKCHVKIQKRDGCDSMKCESCGYAFCWKCGSPRQDGKPHDHKFLGRDSYSQDEQNKVKQEHSYDYYDDGLSDDGWSDDDFFNEFDNHLDNNNFEGRLYRLPQHLQNKVWNIYFLHEDGSRAGADLILQELAKIERKAKAQKKVKKKKIIKAKAKQHKNKKKIQVCDCCLQ